MRKTIRLRSIRLLCRFSKLYINVDGFECDSQRNFRFVHNFLREITQEKQKKSREVFFQILVFIFQGYNA